MKICDRCSRPVDRDKEPVAVKAGHHEFIYDLCNACIDDFAKCVCTFSMNGLPSLCKAVPSLTPDQRQQVESYYSVKPTKPH